MRAVLQQRAGGPEELVVVELPDPEPGPGQVGLAVEAAGAHLVDTNLRRGEAGPAGTPVFPMIPGREVAGTVDRLGEGVDESWRGQRVVVHLGVAASGDGGADRDRQGRPGALTGRISRRARSRRGGHRWRAGG